MSESFYNKKFLCQLAKSEGYVFSLLEKHTEYQEAFDRTRTYVGRNNKQGVNLDSHSPGLIYSVDNYMRNNRPFSLEMIYE